MAAAEREIAVKVFVSTDFTGYHPVGASAVVVAETEEQARGLLSAALIEQGLKFEGTLQQLFEFDGTPQQLFIEEPRAWVFLKGVY